MDENSLYIKPRVVGLGDEESSYHRDASVESEHYFVWAPAREKEPLDGEGGSFYWHTKVGCYFRI